MSIKRNMIPGMIKGTNGNIPIIGQDNFDTRIILHIDNRTGNSKITIEGTPVTDLQVLGAFTQHSANISAHMIRAYVEALKLQQAGNLNATQSEGGNNAT